MAIRRVHNRLIRRKSGPVSVQGNLAGRQTREVSPISVESDQNHVKSGPGQHTDKKNGTPVTSGQTVYSFHPGIPEKKHPAVLRFPRRKGSFRKKRRRFTRKGAVVPGETSGRFHPNHRSFDRKYPLLFRKFTPIGTLTALFSVQIGLSEAFYSPGWKEKAGLPVSRSGLFHAK